MKRMLVTALLVAGAALFLSGCNGESPVEPDPVPTPTPSPTPDPAALCDVRRVDIWAERTDKNNQGVVTAWPTGVVPLLHAELRYVGEGQTGFSEDSCRLIDKVSWWVAAGPPCEFLGNLTAETVYLKCNTPGTVTIKAQPQGFSVEPGQANFRIQPGN